MDDSKNYLLKLTKQSLSISEHAIQRDEELILYIDAAIKDLERLGTKINLDNPLLQTAIILFVKSKFGFVDEKEKQKATEAYKNIRAEISISEQEETE